MTRRWKRRSKADKSGLICVGAKSQFPLTLVLKGSRHTQHPPHACSAGIVCCHFNCPPLTSSNGFTFLGLVSTNILYVHPHTHTEHMELARSLSRSTIKRDTSISCHRCHGFAHCSQLRVNGTSSFSHLQIDRHSSYFYLCIKAETVFILCQLELCLSLRKSI